MLKCGGYLFYVCAAYLLIVSISLSAAEPQIPGQVLDWQKAAQDSVAQNDTTKAVEYYRKIQESFPDTLYAIDAQCRIVNLYLQDVQTDKSAEALTQLKANYSSFPEYVKLVHELGWEFVKKQDYATGLQIYKDLQIQFPNHQRSVWFQRSIVQTYLEQGDIVKVKQAVEDMKNNYQSHPDYVNQMTMTADRLRGKNQSAIASGIYDYLLKQMPDNNQAVIWKRMQIQIALNTGQRNAAKAEVEALFSDYRNNPEFVKQVHELGWEFVQKSDYTSGLRIYKGLQEHFPDHPRAAWFQRSVIQTCLEQGDTHKALEAVEQMKTNFQNHPDYVNQMEKLVGVLVDKNQPAVARDVCNVLLEKYLNHPRLPWILQCKARSEVWMKQPQLADVTVAMMQQKCATDPNFADAMSWTAYEYRKAGYYERAIELYEALLAQNPPPKVQLRSIASIAQAYIQLGNYAGVEERTDYMLSHFKDNIDGLRFYLQAIMEDCYNTAINDIDDGPVNENAQILLNRAIQIGQNPVFSSDSRVMSLLALCYRRLWQAEKATLLYNKAVVIEPALAQGNQSMQMILSGDRYCGAYVVWHVLKYYGKTVSIDDIAIRMGIPQKEYATVQDIIKAFEVYEIPAQAVRIPTDKVVQLDTPFVQYQIPAAGSQLGHFVLCIPAGNGKAIILDGVQEPRVIDFTSYGAKEPFWDGTIILIQQGREDYLGSLFLQKISWETAMATGQCWLDDSDDCYYRTGLYYSRLNEQRQACLRGGCLYLCQDNGRPCFTSPECTNNSQCNVGSYVCYDETHETRCQRNDSGSTSCHYHQGHDCGPKKALAGECGGTYCTVDPTRIINSKCDNKWIYQCDM
jgi:tetratricopeptide (TPR) repeat protein